MFAGQKMVFRCIECHRKFSKTGDLKRHFYQHLNMAVRPLKCRFESCNWYGVGQREYTQHKLTQKHLSNLETARHVGRDEAIPNPRKYEVEDDVWEEVEGSERSGEEERERNSRDCWDKGRYLSKTDKP